MYNRLCINALSKIQPICGCALSIQMRVNPFVTTHQFRAFHNANGPISLVSPPLSTIVMTKRRVNLVPKEKERKPGSAIHRREIELQEMAEREKYMTKVDRWMFHIIDRFIPSRIMRKMTLFNNIAKTYEQLTFEIDVEEFFQEFDMPDTFASWFTVVELHVYCLAARLMKEPKYGHYARDMVTDSFWNDVEFKSRQLGPRATLYRRRHLIIMSWQFQAAFYGYDEGTQSNDIVLASMVWRRFFGFKCEDAEKVERIVKYIRVQLQYLTSLHFDDIVLGKKVLTIPLKDVQVG